MTAGLILLACILALCALSIFLLYQTRSKDDDE